MARQTFTAVFEEAEDGITVTVPALPGLVTFGRTMDEAEAMVRDAIRCHLEGLRKDGEELPIEQHVGTRKLEIEIPAA